MIDVVTEAAATAIPEYPFFVNPQMGSGSTDMGELSCVMPVVHPYTLGATGKAHGSDYQIADPEAACIGSAKLQLEMLHILLSDGASRAKKVIDEFEPMFASKEEYFAYVDKLNCSGDRIEYLDNNIAKVNME